MYQAAWHGVTALATYAGARPGSGSAPVETVEQFRRRRRKVIGQNIVIARKLAGISQENLARALDVQRPQVSKWERGLHEPEAYLQRIATILHQPKSFFTTEHSEEEVAELLDEHDDDVPAEVAG